MVFSSIPFLFFFLPIVLICYYLVPFKLKNYVLLVFSLIFYAWGEPVYIILMIFSCLLNYFYALYHDKVKNKKLLFILCIVANLLILGFFKYADFLIDIINSIFRLNINPLKLALPIGISFFTFQTMSYSIDVYRSSVVPERNFFYFTTYVSMFPQLIAGPIVRYETISKELYKRDINFNNFSDGLLRFMQGLFKKVLIANNIGYLWTTLSSMESLSIASAWLGIIAYTFQIYFDFSAYSDMAIGMGKMLGFNYLENFNYPYISKSVTEFWRRWHISLSSWFKDYVYIPLGGSKCSRIKHIRNILIVWCLTGIWHGASYNFMLWGLYYGIILIIEKFFLKGFLSKLPNTLKHIYTMLVVIIGWLIFASTDLSMFSVYFSNMFNIFKYPFIDETFIFYFKSYFIIIVISTLLSMPIYQNIKKKLNSRGWMIISLILYLVFFFITVSYLVSDSYNPFLYFRF
ncbi:MAG: MBOAT family protein [Bacillales bacterium]|nr:MBOAT family protein [Bacillales bacterium]